MFWARLTASRCHSRTIPVGNAPYWRRDPLAHPDIRRMSAREIADLPIDPSLIDDQ